MVLPVEKNTYETKTQAIAREVLLATQEKGNLLSALR